MLSLETEDGTRISMSDFPREGVPAQILAESLGSVIDDFRHYRIFNGQAPVHDTALVRPGAQVRLAYDDRQFNWISVTSVLFWLVQLIPLITFACGWPIRRAAEIYIGGSIILAIYSFFMPQQRVPLAGGILERILSKSLRDVLFFPALDFLGVD